MHNQPKPTQAALTAIMSILQAEPTVLAPVLRAAAFKAADEMQKTVIDTERANIMKRVFKETVEQHKLPYDDSVVRNFHNAVDYFGKKIK